MVRDEKEPGGGLSHIEPLGAKLLDGVRVLGKRVTRTATATVAEGWYSPELQEILVLKVGDPEVYRAELTEIVQKEPDATSFYPPKGYKILSDIEQQEQR
ncbi:hypothetical protein [Terriglobus saanensis]|nr:hypothetical protein [Terriglobus saanensis]